MFQSHNSEHVKNQNRITTLSKNTGQGKILPLPGISGRLASSLEIGSLDVLMKNLIIRVFGKWLRVEIRDKTSSIAQCRTN